MTNHAPRRPDCEPVVLVRETPPDNHDALESPDGEIVLLTRLCEGQKATVLTLPTQAKTANQEEAQQRVAPVGWHSSSCTTANKIRPLPSGALLPAEHGRDKSNGKAASRPIGDTPKGVGLTSD
jgi:hypothetical protein